MKETTLVSVIVPCFNQGCFLSEALDSIISQTYTNWECIVINDGSTDNTESVGKKYCLNDSRIKYIYQRNQGVIAARNNAIKESSGEIILPLDADDKVAPVYMEKAVQYLQQHKNCKVVYGKGWLIGKENGPFKLPEFSFEGLLRDNCIFNSAFYRRRDFDAVGGYNPNMAKGYEDWNLWISLLEDGGYAHQLDDVVYYYRIQSLSRTTGADQNEVELKLQIIENHQKAYLQHYMSLYDKYSALVAKSWWYKVYFLLRRFKYLIRN